VLHREREDELLEVVLHHVRQVAEQPVQHAHLLVVHHVEQLQRPQVLRGAVVRTGVVVAKRRR
jgi:hypothetical protein